MLGTAYYLADLVLAATFPVAVLLACRRGWLSPQAWTLFWVGVAIGTVWEIPIFALSAWSEQPVLHWLTPLPAHPAVFVVAHSLWDGALLLGGLELATQVTRRVGGSPFGPLGLSVQVLWGQVTELVVELSAITANTWVYLDGLWFNPPLAHFEGQPLPATLQGIWLVASLIFAAIAHTLRWTTPQPDPHVAGREREAPSATREGG